ncbi:MAG: hemerythrin domain-containing protein [Thermodesulfobacteriota bacterium]
MAGKLDAIAEFREDHRKVRDDVLELTDALKNKNVTKAREVLGRLDSLTGPHFRYEEEELYPAMKDFLGEYVDQLIKEHTDIVNTAKACAGLLCKDELTDQEADEGQKAAKALLIHVSNCDGLAILSERLTPEQLDDLGDKFWDYRQKDVSLLEWADKIRTV